MTETTNLHLPQFASSDRIMHDDFNDAFAALDTAVAANAAALALKGNCRIETRTYTGTGTAGRDHPNSMTFPFPPDALLLQGGDGHHALMLRGQTFVTLVYTNSDTKLQLTWDGCIVSWYNTSSNASSQFNESGKTYHVIAFAAV